MLMNMWARPCINLFAVVRMRKPTNHLVGTQLSDTGATRPFCQAIYRACFSHHSVGGLIPLTISTLMSGQSRSSFASLGRKIASIANSIAVSEYAHGDLLPRNPFEPWGSRISQAFAALVSETLRVVPVSRRKPSRASS
jgi:hypothetical protein